MRLSASRGFTLLELLLAVAIFSIISVSSYQLIRYGVQGQENSQQRYESFIHLSRCSGLIESSLLQVVARPIRNGGGDVIPAFIGEDRAMEFSHGGWSNPLEEQRGELRRSHFEVVTENNPDRGAIDYWQLSQWPVLDRAHDSEAEEVIRCEINSIELSYLDHSETWQSTWPVSDVNNSHDTLPKAVEVSIETPEFGQVDRLFTVGSQPPPLLRSKNKLNGASRDR